MVQGGWLLIVLIVVYVLVRALTTNDETAPLPAQPSPRQQQRGEKSGDVKEDTGSNQPLHMHSG